MKNQIIIIHGGDTFDTHKQYLSFLKNKKVDFKRYKTHQKDWKATLGEKLGKKFEVISPSMPNKQNAKYPEWRIWFKKFIPYFKPKAVLIGHSLGGMFLIKYLSENKLPQRIRAVFLVSPPYDNKKKKDSLVDFKLPKILNKIDEQIEKIFIYHSKDDPVVPFSNAKKYLKILKNSTFRV